MSEPYHVEDEAALYVLGGLTAQERLEFEARLAQSAELRALVNDLEEGAVALSMASPPNRPPRALWKQIEKAVADHSQSIPSATSFFSSWWRNRWAIATACVIGWLFHALWINHAKPGAVPAPTAQETRSAPKTSLSEGRQVRRAAQVSADSDTAAQLLQAKLSEIAGLRGRVAELESHMTLLSQTVVQQQSLLGETNRIKFFQLSMASNGGSSAASAKLSPELQRAIFLAMARELGWLPAPGSTPAPDGDGGDNGSGPTNQWKVNFVDLRPGSNGVANPFAPVTSGQTQSAENSISQTPVSNTPIAIPAFVSGDNVILAIDSSLAPSGSQLTFSSGSTNNGQQLLGTTAMGEDPIVVTVPSSAMNGGNTFTITTGGPGGSSNVFQFYTP